MLERWEVHWTDEYISGYEEIDGYHKEIIEGVDKIYKMYEESSLNTNEILNLALKTEETLLKHMDIEINNLKKFNFPEAYSHEASHDNYKKKLELYNRYNIPDLIRGLLITEVSLDYMKEHFFVFDLRDLPKIREKLKESGEVPK